MKLLDLFCGAGGAAMGYHRAGFEVVGVDVKPQPRYPFAFHQADAMTFPLEGFDAIHASPPCQAFSNVTGRNRHPNRHPELVDPVRALLRAAGVPYIIENVVGAPLRTPILLCGSMFGLDVQRHRLFETSFAMLRPDCQHGRWKRRFRSLDTRQRTLSKVVGVHGHTNYDGELELRKAAMCIDWMNNRELTHAIPPAYTEFIGRALVQFLLSRGASRTT